MFCGCVRVCEVKVVQIALHGWGEKGKSKRKGKRRYEGQGFDIFCTLSIAFRTDQEV